MSAEAQNADNVWGQESMCRTRSVRSDPGPDIKMQEPVVTVVVSTQVSIPPNAHRRHLYCESLYKLRSVVG